MLELSDLSGGDHEKEFLHASLGQLVGVLERFGSEEQVLFANSVSCVEPASIC